MRTTVAVDDNLLASAKRRAAERGQSLGQVIDDALRRLLAVPSSVRPGPPVPVFAGGDGPRPGIDLRSNRALAEELDRDVDVDKLR